MIESDIEIIFNKRYIKTLPVVANDHFVFVNLINEAPRRKRTGYQSGKNLILLGGTRSFPPNPSSACLPHRKRMGYSKDHNEIIQVLSMDICFNLMAIIKGDGGDIVEIAIQPGGFDIQIDR